MRMIVHGCEVEYCLPCLLVDLLKVLCHKIYYYRKVCNIKSFFCTCTDGVSKAF